MSSPQKQDVDPYITPPSSLNQGVNEQSEKTLFQRHSKVGKLAFISGVLSLSGMQMGWICILLFPVETAIDVMHIIRSYVVNSCLMPLTLILAIVAFCQRGYPKQLPFIGLLCVQCHRHVWVPIVYSSNGPIGLTPHCPDCHSLL